MASHLASIGFPVRSEAEAYALVSKAAEHGRIVQTAKGDYVAWTDTTGAELWVQRDTSGGLIGFAPHFFGKTGRRVGLQARITRPASTALDGAFYGWANPQDESSESGDYPFVFDAPDYRSHDKLRLPARAQVQLTAFAHELSAHSSEEQYYASQKGLAYAAEAFVPSGLFSAQPDAEAPPQALAIFAGRVLQFEHMMNAITGTPFAWMQVNTLGGEVDVVADPSIIQGQVVLAGVVFGSFWLSGRIVGLDP
jgi:hypothetical protein